MNLEQTITTLEIAEMNKNLEQIASKEKSYREAKTKTLPVVLWI